jgi:hypothetical protein
MTTASPITSPAAPAAKKSRRIATRRPRFSPPSLILALAGVFAAVLFASCTDSDEAPGPAINRANPAGKPRSLALGLAALPAERTQASYLSAFATAAQYSDIVVIQRAPPWSSFLPGATVSAGTRATAELERDLLRQYEPLRLFYVIDPTDPAVSRTRIAEPPPGVDAFAGFRDPGLRAAFVNYAAYVANAYEPAYLALGAEVNMLAERDPLQFEAFLEAYAEAYRVAKAASPKTKIFATFQLEDLLGQLGEPHAPAWEILDAFAGRLDVLAVTTYPYLAGLRSWTELPDGFWAYLKTRFEGEVIIAGTAASSAPVEGQAGTANEEEQDAYLARALDEAERQGFGVLVWSVPFDPVYARSGALVAFRDSGLRRSDGANKLAWTTWEVWAQRPWRRDSP